MYKFDIISLCIYTDIYIHIYSDIYTNIYICIYIYCLPCPYFLLCSRSIAPNSLYVVCWIEPPLNMFTLNILPSWLLFSKGAAEISKLWLGLRVFQSFWQPGHLLTHHPGQDGHHFTEDIFKYIFMNEKFCILIKISLRFVPKSPIDNNPALVQVMTWRRPGDKPLSEPMLTQFTDAYTRH